MNRFANVVGCLSAALLALMWVAPAQAQATRTWVSGVGDDANPCSRTAPCKTFPGAISKTAAGGEIDVLDPGGFGGVTITKAITLDGSGGSVGSILVSGSPGITVNATANDTITIRNISLEGLGATTSASGTWGIRFLAGAVLNVQHCIFKNFRDPTNGTGIGFFPASGTSSLNVSDTILNGNGTSAGNLGGIVIKPTGSGSATVAISGSQIVSNGAGIRADSTGTTGTVRGTVANSVVSNNAFNGVSAIAGTGVATLMVENDVVSGNLNGLVVNGTAASLYANRTSISGNGTGLLLNPSGHLFTYHTNSVDNNTTSNGAFTDVLVPE